jgi:hypothetical protein
MHDADDIPAQRQHRTRQVTGHWQISPTFNLSATILGSRSRTSGHPAKDKLRNPLFALRGRNYYKHGQHGSSGLPPRKLSPDHAPSGTSPHPHVWRRPCSQIDLCYETSTSAPLTPQSLLGYKYIARMPNGRTERRTERARTRGSTAPLNFPLPAYGIVGKTLSTSEKVFQGHLLSVLHLLPGRVRTSCLGSRRRPLNPTFSGRKIPAPSLSCITPASSEPK